MKTKEKVLGIIPARIGSARLPKKMLEDLGGKTLIQRTYERSKGARKLDALVVATDSEDIAKSAEAVGAPVIMWPLPLKSKNGTEGTYEALKQFTDFSPDIVVTIWGDEPLYPAEVIDECIKMLRNDQDLQIVTAADRITDPGMIDSNSVVKIVTDIHNRALYISRSVIPYQYEQGHKTDHYHVIGTMAMRTGFLSTYVNMEQTPLECIEGVEQLRVIENGYELGIVKGDFNNLGVNTPEELIEVRRRYEEGLVE